MVKGHLTSPYQVTGSLGTITCMNIVVHNLEKGWPIETGLKNLSDSLVNTSMASIW